MSKKAEMVALLRDAETDLYLPPFKRWLRTLPPAQRQPILDRRGQFTLQVNAFVTMQLDELLAKLAPVEAELREAAEKLDETIDALEDFKTGVEWLGKAAQILTKVVKVAL